MRSTETESSNTVSSQDLSHLSQHDEGRTSSKDAAVIFIHGISGSPEGTWRDMWRCFEQDSAFAEHVIDFYAYPTRLFRLPFTPPLPDLKSIAEGLGTFLDEQHGHRRQVSIVAHSLGGLVARQLIVSRLRENRPIGVKRLALIAVPHTGSMLANVGRHISWRNRQLLGLTRDHEALLRLNADWLALKAEEQLAVRYIVGGSDSIVPSESAAPFPLGPDRKRVIIEASHTSIVRPTDVGDIRYRSVGKFLVPNELAAGASALASRRKPDPLFDAYTPADSPYYVNRGTDGVIAEALACGHVWLIGASGVGKTAALRRAVYESGWSLKHINLSGYNVNCALDLFRCLAHEIAAMTTEESLLDANDDHARCCNYLKDVLRLFSPDMTLAIVVEELPVEVQELTKFANLVGQFLEMLALDPTLYGRLAFAFSSINDVEAVAAKTRDKIQFLLMGSWSSEETSELVDRLVPLIRPELSSDERHQIVIAAQGSPRFVKHLFRLWKNKIAPEMSLSAMLTRVQKEIVT